MRQFFKVCGVTKWFVNCMPPRSSPQHDQTMFYVFWVIFVSFSISCESMVFMTQYVELFTGELFTGEIFGSNANKCNFVTKLKLKYVLE